jgi:hypothetical protein
MNKKSKQLYTNAITATTRIIILEIHFFSPPLEEDPVMTPPIIE